MRAIQLFAYLLVFISTAFAYEARVLEVVPGEVSFVKLDNGEVRFLEEGVNFKVGQIVQTDTEGFSLEDSTYEPTVLTDKATASVIFESFRPRAKRRSQCYNRAHIWAYEEYQRRGTKLMKTFVFFTNRYIRNYRYKWWFHVAPSTFVEENGEKKEVVLDWTFFDNPEETDEWTKYFVKSGRACPTVPKYSDYENHQEAEDCYLIKTSMYFWQPLDIEAYEQTGVEKTEFIDHEVKRAYRQAF